MDLVTKLEKAAQVYDREGTEEAAGNLVAYVRGHGPWPDEKALRKALTALRDNRWFGALQSTADAMIHAGDTRPAVRRLYAQALIDRGAIAGAIPFLQRLEKECRGDADEYDEARGLIGRAWKQAYVNSDGLTKARGKELLENAIDAYYTTWRQRKKLWHGVNALALLARAADDGIRVSGRFPDRRDLAQKILDAVQALGPAAEAWDFATAAEACVGLRKWKDALLWLNQYVRSTSAFAIAGTLRQFTEVWRLSTEDERGGAALVHLLRAEMLQKPGGEDVDLGGGASSISQGADDLLQAVLGDDRYVSLEWYRLGLERSRAVARIGLQKSQGLGTGFLVRARDVGLSHSGQVLVTNYHVIPGQLPHDRAVVTFEALDGGRKAYGIKSVLWSSPIEKLDCAIVRLSSEVKGIEPYPLSAAVPAVKKSRVYVIGHPLGQTLSFSISDNVLIDHVDPKIQYRAPTNPGSSGSPVFDSTWALLALHHAGHETKMPKLHGKGVHAANEGLSFAAIAKQCAADRKKKKKS
ncbi:MAG: trypsin-like peptidase domain-containing protein [Thermoanaerobaculia bacterium]